MTDARRAWTRTLVRKLSAWLALVVAVGLVIELLSAVFFLVVSGHWFSYGQAQERRNEIAQAAAPVPEQVDRRPAWIQQDEGAIHPYVGFVLDPDHPRAGGTGEYGLPGIEVVFEPPRPDRVIVLIVGGSVAGQLWEERAPLEAALRELPAYQDKEISIIRVALGGFMEPQQSMAVHYLLALGAHLDIVINLDGFNDVVLPWYDNAREGVFPFYPRAWYGRTGNLADPRLVREAGAVAVLTDLRVKLAARLSRSLLRWSVTANLVWAMTDSFLEQRLLEHRQAASTVDEERPYFRTGPRISFTREQAIAGAVQVWKRSSITIDALARKHGFRYLHLLQPNQYYEGSKPLSDEERREAVRLDQGYGPTARDGYPLLVAAGQEIADAGVHYHDLSMLFADEPRTVYGDSCCHFDPLGKQLLAERVADILRQELAQPVE